jgi:hypothetical protein
MRGAFALYQAVIFCKVDARVKDFWAIFHQVCVCVCVRAGECEGEKGSGG